MVVELIRDDYKIVIVPDNIVNQIKSTSPEYPWGIVMNSGDILYVTDEEQSRIADALKLRDEQIDTLIKNTDTIIDELNTLNSTAISIDTNTSGTKANTAGILTQTQSNGTLLSQIKSVCDNIYSWVRSHYVYTN